MDSAKRKRGNQPVEPDQADAPSVAVPQPGTPEPITTGDMQAVGATSPEEARKRRSVQPDEPPVEESPGDQVSG